MCYSNDNASRHEMTFPQPELPSDLSRCHALIEQLHEEAKCATERAQAAEAKVSHLEALLAEHQETIETQQQTIEDLSADNQLLKRALFGSRRERYEDPAQQLLFDATTLTPEKENQEPVPEFTELKKKRTSNGRQRRVFPEFLLREEERHVLNDDEIPEELRNDPNARRFFKKTGERLELNPMQLKVVEEYQEVIALDQPDVTTAMISAKKPPRLIQSFAGNSLLAYLTVSRFADHLPYYRLENILGRSGVYIDRSTQWRWMRGVAAGITPLVDLMWQRVRLSQVIAMDETPVMELGGPGTTLKGYLWCGVGDAGSSLRLFLLQLGSSQRPPASVSCRLSRLPVGRCLYRLRADW